MKTIKIISVGRKSSSEIDLLTKEYEKRLSSHYRFSWCFIEPAQGKMSLELQRQKESEHILEKLRSNSFILLDETGEQLNNFELAASFNKWSESSEDIYIVIGGAFGVSDNLKKSAHFVWSLSNLVFPHEIVRLVISEQLYRSFSISSGLPYHHK